MIVAHSVKRYSYEEALKKAKAENKIVMIEGFIRFCRGCIKMDREVFVEDRVKEALDKDFVMVKKNMLLEELPLGIKSMGTPSFYFITKDGKHLIDKIQGTGTADEFLEILEMIKQSVKDGKFLK
jgi:thioredoxin-related protein